MGNTKVDLVADLEEVLDTRDMTQVRYQKTLKIIAKAKKGYYHDFDTPLASPKIQLHIDLLDVNLPDIDQKMQNGDYDDESPTPEQQKELLDLVTGKHE